MSSLVVVVVDRYIRVHLLFFLERERKREGNPTHFVCRHVVLFFCSSCHFFVLFICVRPKAISVWEL